jgi:hypothetical protein
LNGDGVGRGALAENCGALLFSMSRLVIPGWDAKDIVRMFSIGLSGGFALVCTEGFHRHRDSLARRRFADYYRTDMTPGAYDGVMRDIRGNHAAFSMRRPSNCRAGR